jgi:hypothetical protein
MAIATYSDLKSRIGEWRFDEGTLLASSLGDFIVLAEARFNNGVEGQFATPALRVRQMETSEDLTLTDGVADLPDAYLEWRQVVAQTSHIARLRYLSPDALDSKYTTVYAGCPNYFTIEGNTIRVRPSTESTIRLKFYEQIPALSDTNTTNWLLTMAPNIYLYGSVLEASIFRGDTDRALEMVALLSGAMSGLTGSDKAARWAQGAAQVSGPTP